MNCIFCKIAKKEIPSEKIYENDKVFCFLDINPVSKGHTLVISKKHYENIFDIPENELKELISVVKKISKKRKKELNADGINLFNANGKIAEQSVSHFHIHIIPRYKNDGINISKVFKQK
ncbi:HIT family protein [Patescibacteria group bacterium]|nr:HIT family protein [Patescibacteria group bacterium]